MPKYRPGAPICRKPARRLTTTSSTSDLSSNSDSPANYNSVLKTTLPPTTNTTSPNPSPDAQPSNPLALDDYDDPLDHDLILLDFIKITSQLVTLQVKVQGAVKNNTSRDKTGLEEINGAVGGLTVRLKWLMADRAGATEDEIVENLERLEREYQEILAMFVKEGEGMEEVKR